MRFQFILYWFLVFLLISCSNNQDEPNIGVDQNNQQEPNVSPNRAEIFLNEILDIMEANSINKNDIDWIDFRSKVFDKVIGAETIQDTYPGIREALILLGDNHSFYIKPDGDIIFGSSLRCDTQNITPPSLPQNIGYVKVDFFSGSSTSSTAISFAQNIQNQIRNQDDFDTIGWIVDLRNNTGGNMWPMIAGIGPILGEGTAGYFINADNVQVSWGFLNGSSIYNGNMVTQLSNSYELTVPNPKVAVLLNNGIASSGEVVAISFIGRENTKSFGVPTCGLSTGNSPFTLSDSSVLNLTTVYLADRNKKLYGIPINPDLIIENDDIIQNAVEWIEN